ncbi:MAG: hypothetical protein M0Z93_04310 [Actinomycetota bacterium]|jgi:hypothetical protein|nr:hypothetical protein [Actinomycetota bacterium]
MTGTVSSRPLLYSLPRRAGGAARRVQLADDGPTRQERVRRSPEGLVLWLGEADVGALDRAVLEEERAMGTMA